jgi:hypothetical protein
MESKLLFDISALISEGDKNTKSGNTSNSYGLQQTDFFRSGALESLENTLPLPLKQDAFYTYVSRGEWSHWELVAYLLQQYAPCTICFCTWSISELSARKLAEWLENGLLTQITALVDYRSKNRHPAAYHLASQHIARMRVTNCHAKVTVLHSSTTGYITIIGSANWTENPRIECGTIITREEVGVQHTLWIEETIENGTYEL